jgi:hypothetical protein
MVRVADKARVIYGKLRGRQRKGPRTHRTNLGNLSSDWIHARVNFGDRDARNPGSHIYILR